MIARLTADEEAEIRQVVGLHHTRAEHGERWACLLLLDEIDRLRDLTMALADRVHKQSELLSRRAETKP